MNLCGEVPHDVASLLKLFFADLPDPLFPFEFYQRFMDTSKSQDPAYRNERYTSLLKEMPALNAIVARFLFEFLYKMIEFADQTKMSATNLGVCFGPTLFRTQNPTTQQLLLAQEKTCVEQMIVNYKGLFEEIGLEALDGPIDDGEDIEGEGDEKKKGAAMPKFFKKMSAGPSSKTGIARKQPPTPVKRVADVPIGSERPENYHSVDLGGKGTPKKPGIRSRLKL